MTRQHHSRPFAHAIMRPAAHLTLLTATAFLSAAPYGIPIATAQETAQAALQTGARDEAITRLTALFRKKGVDLAPYLKHPDFEIYGDIAGKFTGSPERTAGDAYLEALERGDEAAAEQVFDEQYAQYRRNTGFTDKAARMGSFIAAHEERLAAAEKAYGIPAEVIAAVIGIESSFGATTGRYNPFNVYVSMYVSDYRSAFALEQLTELVTFVERTGMDVFDMTSSYAGAIGYMQFIPYSLNHWFVGENVLDMDDNIDSVANYLSHFLKSRGSLDDAIHAYNPSRYYVRLVMDLAEAGKE